METEGSTDYLSKTIVKFRIYYWSSILFLHCKIKNKYLEKERKMQCLKKLLKTFVLHAAKYWRLPVAITTTYRLQNCLNLILKMPRTVLSCTVCYETTIGAVELHRSRKRYIAALLQLEYLSLIKFFHIFSRLSIISEL